jgi:hexosaminidase
MPTFTTFPAVAAVALAVLVATSSRSAAEVAIVPAPLEVDECAGSFVLGRGSAIVASRGARDEAERLAADLRAGTGFPLPVESRGPRRLAVRGVRPGAANALRPTRPTATGNIEMVLVPEDGALGPEGYRIEVARDRVRLAAADRAGLFYAGVTLRQLFPAAIFGGAAPDADWTLPCVRIADRPRFRWRGAMLDVSRHFMPKDFVLRFIDLLALHKLNRFHWHLSDDQGWRLQIRRYPRLTEVGGFRAESPVRYLEELGILNFLANGALNRPDGSPLLDGTPHGGFYTQSEVREVVRYARDRHVEIVPEIDMPGHVQAAIAAYPELGNTDRPIEVATRWGIQEHTLDVEEPTVAFFADVLQEVIDLFPGRFVHLGGDEVLTKQWEESPAAQELIAELGLAGPHELRGYFLGRMIEVVESRGRRAIGWNEILTDGLDPDTAIMSWTGIQPGIDAALAGHDVVMAALDATYLDHPPAISPAAQAALDEIAGRPFDAGPALTPLEQVYSFDPVPPELEGPASARVLGAQAQLWTEFIHDGDEVERRAFPRLSALAEVVWSDRARRDRASFEKRLSEHLERLARLGVHHDRTPAGGARTRAAALDPTRSRLPRSDR